MNIDFDLIEHLKEKVLEIYNDSKEIKDIDVNKKDGNDIVTAVDLYMEKRIIETIKNIFPEHSIYSEECGEEKNKSEYEWFIDPIDGTINFASKVPLFSTSIALKKNNETILGIVCDYNQNDVYYAIKGKGAFCNGKQLKVSNNDTLKDSIISFCLTSHYNNEHIKDVLNVEEKLASKVRGLRLIVSGAIELCWCAAGKIDGVLNVKPSVGLSSAAGKLFVEEAGGKVTNLKGINRENIDTLLVTNGKIHNELVEILNWNKNRILITGAVLGADTNSINIYENLISYINNEEYQISSPLDTMKFKGNDYERYERAMNLLQDTQKVIAEMSNVSTGQGMELQEAVNLNIPILVIAKNGSKISGLVKGCKNVKDVIYYDNISEIKDKVISFINE